MIPIKAFDQNDYLVECELDDQLFFLHFSWNSEAQFWVLGIEDANEQAILQGVVLVANSWLLQQFRILPLPAGDMFVYARNPNEVLDRTAFIEGRAQLYYVPVADLAVFPVEVEE